MRNTLFASTITIAAVSASKISSGLSGDVCLDIINGYTFSGAGVQTWSCNSNPQQSWVYRDGTLQSMNKCLQPVAGTTFDGNLLEIADCSTSASQQWKRVGTTWVIANKYCLDLAGGITWNGRRPQIWSCYPGNENQVWNYDGIGLFNAPSSAGSPPSSSSTERTITRTTTMTSSITTSVRPATTSPGRTTTANNLPGGPSPTSSSAALPTGSHIKPKLVTNMCVDTPGSSNNGATIALAPCTNAATQSWQYTSGTIRSGTSCIDVPDGRLTSGTFLQLWECSPGNTNQQWTRVNNTLVFGGKFCMDVPNGNAKADQALQIWECTTNNQNQQFDSFVA